jgi:hypothetical protein
VNVVKCNVICHVNCCDLRDQGGAKVTESNGSGGELHRFVLGVVGGRWFGWWELVGKLCLCLRGGELGFGLVWRGWLVVRLICLVELESC